MAPKPPNAQDAPAEPWRPSNFLTGSETLPPGRRSRATWLASPTLGVEARRELTVEPPRVDLFHRSLQSQ